MVFRNYDVDKQFFTPRDYQLELVEKACNRNIIVPLGTGSGKTFIAVMLIRERAKDLMPPLEDGGKRAFFLVDKVPLVEQQAAHIEHHTTLTVGRAHGKMNVDYWSDDAWRKTLQEKQVMVMTAQIFLHLVDHGLFSLDRANLLIFDECHHALGKNHPYRLIMHRYRLLPPQQKPRVLGLTASVINNKTPPHKLEALMLDLERALDCHIETASDLVAVSKYGAKPKIVVVACENFDADTSSLCQPVVRWLDGLKSFCRLSNQFMPEFDVDPRRPVVEALERTTAILKQLGPWCAWKVCQIWEKQLQKLAKQQTLGDWQKRYLTMGETYIRGARRILEPQVKTVRTLTEAKRFLPDRMCRLLDVLRFFHPDVQKGMAKDGKKGAVDDFCGIIFVEQRYVAYIMKVLLKAICKWDDASFGFLKVDFVIGYSGYNIASEETMALHRRQEDVLRKFRQKQLNLLVATSVLEEGVDVRQCNVVIRFDRPKDYRSFVQSKGRARKEGAFYFALVEERDQAVFSSDLRDFDQIEQILLKRYHSSDNPAAEPIETDVVDKLMPAYEVNVNKDLKGVIGGNARVTMSTAIALVNRYCAKLPSDIFTRLVPQNVIKSVEVDGQIKFKAELTLPINSPIKHVIKSVVPMDRKKYAQMAVALEACKILHQKGELNDNLLPVGKDTIAKLLTQLDDDPDEWVPNLRMKVGSAKRKQLYDKRMAKALNGALPLPGFTSYVYVIDMKLTKPASKEANPKNRKIVDPHDSERCFGFLSVKKLPPIPAFPVFVRQGEVEASISLASSTITVDEMTMALLQQFHSYIFGEVLRLDKFGMVFNSQNAPVNVLILPLRKVPNELGEMSHVLDFVFVRDIVSKIGKIPARPDEEVRRKFQFNAGRFADAIVMPWYRNRDSPHFYYVAAICAELTPASPFPDNQFITFNEYFQLKWGLEVYSQNQPLLDVDYTSSRLNLLTPRFYNRNGKVLRSAMERAAVAASDSTQKQILVPELVDVHPIPASLWNMIVALPSILYRLNCLLLADELRQTVMREAFKVDTVDPSSDFHWPALNYGWPTDDALTESLCAAANERYILATEESYKRHNDTSVEVEKRIAAIEEQERAKDECFDIGVWNPELAEELNLGSSTPWVQTPTRSTDAFEDETAGLMSAQLDAPSNLTDDFEDDEDDILFKLDFKNSVNERLCREQADLFAPRSDIEPTGWDDLADDFQAADDPALPLQLVSVGAQFDRTALLKDVESVVNVGVPIAAVVNGADGKTTAVAGAIRQQTAKQQLWLDTMEMLDDSDRRRGEEDTIDLSQIEDMERDVDERVVKEALNPSLLSNVEFCAAGDSVTSLTVDNGGNPPWNGIEDALEDDNDESRRDSPIVPLIDESPRMTAGAEATGIGSTVLPPDWMNISFEEDWTNSHPFGVSPCLLLQALTMSNASDGINLERLETVGDSFLKYAVTVYLYRAFPDMHEGKLSFGRSKEVSNCNLYRLGKRRGIPHIMVAAKFDPQDSWLPPCYVTTNDFKAPNSTDAEEDDRRMEAVLEGKELADQQIKIPTGWDEADANSQVRKIANGVETINLLRAADGGWEAGDDYTPLPYNLLTQQNISDKAIADAVEALIGAHLLTFGPLGAIQFMNWLGLNVLPKADCPAIADPLLRFVDDPYQQLNSMWQQYQFGKLEQTLNYRFRNRAYLVQAFTHASYYKNRITGCYQRLEFLGDAVLDYVITRFLYEHKNQYSPGVLTDLRSALVNNTIFASLAVKYGFHKYFIAMCPGLYGMIEKFVRLCEDKNVDSANFHDELYMVTEEEIDEGEEEDIEVPKAMGDIFESVAGAVFLDSGCSLDAVWRVFALLMKDTIRECCNNPPKSPIRELLEMEPERARFAKLERIIETGKVRVTVDVQNKCRFTGMGRSYRIAKCTAAKRALRYLKSLEAQKLKDAAAKLRQ